MTEPNFSFTPKLAGDFFTIRGNTLDEFHTNVAAAVANAALLTDLVLLQGALNASVLTAPQPAAQPAQAVTAPPAPATYPVQQPAPPQYAPAPPQYQQQQYGQPQQQYAPPQQQQQYGQPQQAGHVCDCGLEMKLRSSQYGNFYSCAKGQQDPTRCPKKINV